MNAPGRRFDVQAIRAAHPIAELVSQCIGAMRKSGSEYLALCPFHSESSPSFYVCPSKGTFYCHGCRAGGDVIEFYSRWKGLDFIAACEELGGCATDWRGLRLPLARPKLQAVAAALDRSAWMPIMPAPDYAPVLHAGVRVALPNPKQDHAWPMTPSRVDAYRDLAGRLLGYVLRVDYVKRNGKPGKVTPAVTWCISPDGEAGWTVYPFPEPRPLMGLDDLAARPDATVLLVSGEKCREVAAAAFRRYVVVTWPGGDGGIQQVDWTPLKGRDVVLWPDADMSCVDTMLGYVDDKDQQREGISQLLYLVEAKRIRWINVCDPSDDSVIRRDLPKGWDVWDALVLERRSVAQLLAFIVPLIEDVRVEKSARMVAHG